MNKIDKIKYEIQEIYKNLTTKLKKRSSDPLVTEADMPDTDEPVNNQTSLEKEPVKTKRLFEGVPDIDNEFNQKNAPDKVSNDSDLTIAEESGDPDSLLKETSETDEPSLSESDEETIASDEASQGVVEMPVELMSEKLTLIEKIKERKEIASLAVLSLVLIGLIFMVLGPIINNRIITKETASLVGNGFKRNEQVVILPYNGLEDAIIKNESLTVLIMDQRDENRETLEKLMTSEKNLRKMDEPLFIYPLVNDKDRVASYFKVKEGLTLIHFENQKETARKTLNDKEEMTEYLFDYLKALGEGKPAMTASELEKVKAKAGKESQGDKQPKKNSDVIDELKDIII